MHFFNWIIICVGVFSTTSVAKVVDELSFVPPFTHVNSFGDREIPGWVTGGDSSISKHFVRLTPDRQSKKGYMWASSEQSFPSEFSLVMKFRIGGQGKSLFGDGLALWLVQDGHHVPGNFHGYSENYIGIGIVFDTFRNHESLSPHKDVSIYYNNGSLIADALYTTMEGCDAALRYHENRGDFSAANSTRVRVSLRNSRFAVFIDEKNTGDWKECITRDLDFMPSDWHTRARPGVTATTGGLADNHDVLSLKVFDNALESTLLAHSQSDLRRTNDVTKFQQHMEYQIHSVKEALNSNLKKIKNEEDQAELRIAKLEGKLTDQLVASIAERLEEIEGANLGKMDTKRRRLDERIKELENKVHKRMNERLSILEKQIGTMAVAHIKKSGSVWIIPFIILVGFVIIFCIITLLKYFTVKKQHSQ